MDLRKLPGKTCARHAWGDEGMLSVVQRGGLFGARKVLSSCFHSASKRGNLRIVTESSASFRVVLEGVTKTYPPAVRALRGVSAEFVSRRVSVVVGANGSGK